MGGVTLRDVEGDGADAGVASSTITFAYFCQIDGRLSF